MTKEEKRAYHAKFYQANREKILAQNAAWRKANPGKVRAMAVAWVAANPEKTRAATAAWRKANPERARAMCAAWRKANPEGANAARVAWATVNPEKGRADCANRRARISGAEGRHTAEEVKRLLARQKYLCAVCKKSIEVGYHKDHIVPLSRGGSNYIRNIQLLCPTCNCKKGSKHPIRFMREMGYLL
jgi:hypothetical protein